MRYVLALVAVVMVLAAVRPAFAGFDPEGPNDDRLMPGSTLYLGPMESTPQVDHDNLR
jgi:hypothetical protein